MRIHYLWFLSQVISISVGIGSVAFYVYVE